MDLRFLSLEFMQWVIHPIIKNSFCTKLPIVGNCICKVALVPLPGLCWGKGQGMGWFAASAGAKTNHVAFHQNCIICNPLTQHTG